MSLSNAWGTTTPASAAKKNLTSVISGTGAYLAGLTKTNFKIVTCTSTGSGFIIDHVYLFSEDGSTIIDISSTLVHSHSDSNSGGSLQQVHRNNSHVMDLALTRTNDLKKAQWIETVTGTGSIEDKIDGTTGERSIRLRPNGTTSSGSTISYPHLKLNFAKQSTFNAKLQIETASSLALHSGVNCDDVTAADSNTIKYNAEVCTATNSNWFLRSANGSANSTSDSGIAMSTSRVSIKMDHFPDLGTPRIDMFVDAASVFQKTTHIPTTGTSADNNLVKHSVKNNTGADRPLLVYATRLSYTISDSWR